MRPLSTDTSAEAKARRTRAVSSMRSNLSKFLLGDRSRKMSELGRLPFFHLFSFPFRSLPRAAALLCRRVCTAEGLLRSEGEREVIFGARPREACRLSRSAGSRQKRVHCSLRPSSSTGLSTGPAMPFSRSSFCCPGGGGVFFSFCLLVGHQPDDGVLRLFVYGRDRGVVLVVCCFWP